MVRVAACGCDCEDCLAEAQDHRCLCEPLETHESEQSDDEEPNSDDLSAVVDDLESDSSYVPHTSPEYEEEEYLCPFHSQCVDAAEKVENLLSELLEPREDTDADERLRYLVEHICAFYQ